MDEFIRYWGRIVIPIVLKKSTGSSGMKLAFWLFVLSALVACVFVGLFFYNLASTDVVDFTIEQFNNYAYSLGLSIFVALGSIGVVILTIPPEINKAQEDEINKLDNELSSFAPEIQATGLFAVHDVSIGHYLPDGRRVTSHVTNLASALFVNKPRFPNQNNNAKNIRAEIDFLDENRTAVLVSIQGRWQGKEPSEINSGDKTILESTNFPNNGAPRWLDLIMKYPEDEYCYAYSNDSYGQDYFQHPNHLIEAKRFFIHVRLLGEYMPGNLFEFEVETKGIGDTFQIRRNGEEWKRDRNSQAKKIIPQEIKPIPREPIEIVIVKKKSSQRKTSSRH